MKQNSLIVFSLVALACFSAWSNDAPDPSVRRLSREEFGQLSGSERRAYLDKLFVINHGGMVTKKGTGKGSIKIMLSIVGFDCKLLNEKLAFYDKLMKWPVSIVKGDSVTVATADAALKKQQANIAVFVVEDETLPTLLSAPESGWAIVNAKRLKESGTVTTVNRRITKEILRGLCMATGCWNIGNIMDAVRSQSELDLITNLDLPLTARGGMMKTMASFGVEPRIEKSYKNACQEGWAPAPTNDFQKAIWEKVHSAPEKPVKITYDKDKKKPVVK